MKEKESFWGNVAHAITRATIVVFWCMVAALAPLIALVSALSFGVCLGVWFARRETRKAENSVEAEELDQKISGGTFN